MQKIADKTFLLTPAQRRGLGRGEGPLDGEGLLQPVLKRPCSSWLSAILGHEGWLRRRREHGRGDGAGMGRRRRRPRGDAVLRPRASAQRVADEVGGETRAEPAGAGRDSRVVVLAVKPGASKRWPRSWAGRRRLWSRSSRATPTARIAELFPGVPALRLMPNQPVEVRRGVLCYVAARACRMSCQASCWGCWSRWGSGPPARSG